MSCFLAAVCTPGQSLHSLSLDFDIIGLELFYFLFGNTPRTLQIKTCDFIENCQFHLSLFVQRKIETLSYEEKYETFFTISIDPYLLFFFRGFSRLVLDFSLFYYARNKERKDKKRLN